MGVVTSMVRRRCLLCALASLLLCIIDLRVLPPHHRTGGEASFVLIFGQAKATSKNFINTVAFEAVSCDEPPANSTTTTTNTGTMTTTFTGTTTTTFTGTTTTTFTGTTTTTFTGTTTTTTTSTTTTTTVTEEYRGILVEVAIESNGQWELVLSSPSVVHATREFQHNSDYNNKVLHTETFSMSEIGNYTGEPRAIVLKDAKGDVVSCVSWNGGSDCPTSFELESVKSDTIWRLVSRNASAFVGDIEEDFIGGNVANPQAVEVPNTDTCRLGMANKGQSFVVDNNATAFVNEVVYNKRCGGAGAAISGIEVAIYSTNVTRFALAAEDHAGVRGVALLRVVPGWNVIFTGTEEFATLFPNSTTSFGNFMSGIAVLYGENEDYDRDVKSMVAWGAESKTGQIGTSPTYPYLITTDPLTGSGRMELNGRNMTVSGEGFWRVADDNNCSPGRINSDQTLFTSVVGAAFLRVSVWWSVVAAALLTSCSLSVW